MRIYDLIDNGEFSFNVPFRILEYIGDDRTILVYDSTTSADIPFDIVFENITAVNMGDDGVVEIEYSELAPY